MKELWVDPNIGLLPYVPFAVLFSVVIVARSLWRRSFSAPSLHLGAIVIGMMFLCTATVNWNNGTSGPSRYLIWMLPILFTTIAREGGGPIFSGTAALPAAWVAVGLHLGIVAAGGGVLPRISYVRHSVPARVLLAHAPAWYRPTPEIFIERTLGREGAAATPVIYPASGACRKALVGPQDRASLEARCGPLPDAARAWFSRNTTPGKPAALGYVDF